uniref:Leucine rich repeat containing 73 n=1 Tax=Neogobius melanostomus TaxID=47308 RepID=A0A8C6SL24_9GOBI
MVPVCIQFCEDALSPVEVRSVVQSLDEDRVQLVSLRGCRVSDQDFERICESVGRSRSLLQLHLSLGLVSGPDRTRDLARALLRNRICLCLSLHGNALAAPDALVRSLALHPALLSLDLGDCSLSDQTLEQVCGLLPPDGARPGLKELTLSSNPAVSARGWTRLCVAVAHSSQLRVLRLDYNALGDRVAEMLAVAVASSRTLETLDLEGTGLTNTSAQNRISPEIQTEIQDLLSETDDEPIRERRRQQPPVQRREAGSAVRPLSGNRTDPHTVLLTSGLGDSLLDETQM